MKLELTKADCANPRVRRLNKVFIWMTVWLWGWFAVLAMITFVLHEIADWALSYALQCASDVRGQLLARYLKRWPTQPQAEEVVTLSVQQSEWPGL